MGKINTACLILGGGEILDYTAVKEMLPDDCFVICADSGYHHCSHLGIQPNLLVGDFDSIKSVLPQDIPVVRLSAEKDYTDTYLAVEEALSRKLDNIILAGMTGGRSDHTFANIQIIASLSTNSINSVMTDGITDYYALSASGQTKSISIPFKANHYFSVFALGGICTCVNIQGGKYPLTDYDLRFDEARAVSNEFLSGPAVVSLKAGTVLIITTPK